MLLRGAGGCGDGHDPSRPSRPTPSHPDLSSPLRVSGLPSHHSSVGVPYWVHVHCIVGVMRFEGGTCTEQHWRGTGRLPPAMLPCCCRRSPLVPYHSFLRTRRWGRCILLVYTLSCARAPGMRLACRGGKHGTAWHPAANGELHSEAFPCEMVRWLMPPSAELAAPRPRRSHPRPFPSRRLHTAPCACTTPPSKISGISGS